MTKITFRQKGERGAHGEVEYEVLRGEEVLGTVERYAHPSYRSMGRGSRIRGSLQGYTRGWRPLLPLGEVEPRGVFKRLVYETRYGSTKGLYLTANNSTGEQTRSEAAELLIKWRDHPELRRQSDV